MNEFEKKLSQQPLKQIPAEWRAEIIACASSQSNRTRSQTSRMPVLRILHEFFWPNPKAWAGLAAVWIFIFALNVSVRDKSPAVAEKASPPSPEALVQLKQQREMFAQLIGANEPRVADRQKIISPKPRSEWAEMKTV
ncbi:MAG TPA: hypothetical protein VFV23_04365 [Verrucomicrobiae bacterium]|nr:hypothetical protein [Verrucomicrobiae bacterium]